MQSDQSWWLCIFYFSDINMDTTGENIMIKKELQFHSDGKFKIMQMADIQEIPSISPDTILFLEAAVEKEKPDLIILTGDQIKGYDPGFRGENGRDKVRQVLQQILLPACKRNIPIAVTLGNHDEQAGLTDQEMSSLYMEFENCITGHIDEEATFTFHIPIQSSHGGQTALNLYLFNSQGDAKEGGYQPMLSQQLTWYRHIRDELKEQNGQYVPSLVFQHIPFAEFYHVLRRVHANAKGAIRAYRTHKNEYYVLNEEYVRPGGRLLEPPSIPDIDIGEYSALSEKGDILGVFVGHDHKNNFVADYKGMQLGYTPSCGFNAYGPGTERAVRIFCFQEDQLSKYETYTVSYRELLGKKVKKPLINYLYEHAPTTMDAFLTAAVRVIGVLLLIAAALTAFLFIH